MICAFLEPHPEEPHPEEPHPEEPHPEEPHPEEPHPARASPPSPLRGEGLETLPARLRLATLPKREGEEATE